MHCLDTCLRPLHVAGFAAEGEACVGYYCVVAEAAVATRPMGFGHTATAAAADHLPRLGGRASSPWSAMRTKRVGSMMKLLRVLQNLMGGGGGGQRLLMEIS